MEDLSDPALLQAWSRCRCERAFAELVRRHAGQVRSEAMRVARDACLADDVTQEVFLALTRHASRLCGRDSLFGWFRRTAANLAKNTVRSEERRRGRERQAAALRLSDSMPPDGHGEEGRAAQVDEALASLDGPFRDVLLLRFFERQNAHQTGERLGISRHAAQKRITRALAQLRTRLRPLPPATSVSTPPGPRRNAARAVSGLGAAAVVNSGCAGASPSFLLTQFFFMTTTTLKIGLAALLAAGFAIPLALQHREISRLREELNALPKRQEAGKPSRLKNRVPMESVPYFGKKEHSDEPPGNVSKAAAGRGGRWKDALINDLKDPEWRIRRGAAATLRGSTVPAALAVPSLTGALGDKEWQVRKAVSEALGYYGAEAAGAVPGLVRALADQEWQVRMPAAEALAAIGDGARAAAPELAAALRDEEWQVRNAAAMALATIPPLNADAVPMLAGVLNDEEWQVIANASMALGAIGPSAAATVPALSAALKHEEANVRLAAAYALGSIGQPDPEAVLGLKGLAADDDMRVRQHAMDALAKLGAGGSP